MATVTLRNAQVNQPESAHAGVNAAVCRVSLSITLSVGDVHLIGKIPHDAIPIGAVFYPGAAVATGTVAKFGTSASQELFFASATYSNIAYSSSRPLGSRQQISLSDDAAVRYDWLVMVGTAGISVGHVGDLVVTYKMAGQTL